MSSYSDGEAERELVAAAAFRQAVIDLADEWMDEAAEGECPDGFCGACTLGTAGQRLRLLIAGGELDV